MAGAVVGPPWWVGSLVPVVGDGGGSRLESGSTACQQRESTHLEEVEGEGRGGGTREDGVGG